MSAPNRLFLLFGSLLLAVALGALVGRYDWPVAALLLAVSVVLLLAARPLWTVAAILLAVPLGQFGRIPPGAASGSLLVLDFLVGFLFVLWLVWLVYARSRLLLSPAHGAWLAFLAVAAISFLLTPLPIGRQEMVQNGFYLLRLAAYSSLAWSVPALFPDAGSAGRLLRWLIWTGLAVVALGFVQLYVLPDIGVLSRYGWDPHVGRLVSSFLDPNYLGGYLALLLALLFSRSVQEGRRPNWLAICLTLVAAVLTFSRSGYLAVAIVLAIFGLRYSWKLMLLGIVVAVPLALAIPRVGQRIAGGFAVDATAQDRIISWQNALQVSNRWPVLGVGYNNYKNAQEELHIIGYNESGKSNAGSDSSLLNILATTGVPGLCLFLLTICLVLRRCLAVLRQAGRSPQAVAALTLLVAAPTIALFSWFVNALFYPFILVTLAFLVGMAYVPLPEVRAEA